MQDTPVGIPYPESPDLPPPIPPGQKKSSKAWIIILVVFLLLCCLCVFVGGGIWLWNNGDALIEQMDMGMHVLPLV